MSFSKQTGSLLLLVLLVTAAPSWAADDTKLGKLTCLSPAVEALQEPVASELQITQETLQGALIANVKASLPRLDVRDDLDTCLQNVLYVQVSLAMIPSAGGRTLGFHGHVTLELYRDATVVETTKVARVVVWEDGTLLVGPPGAARSQILRALDKLLAAFTADYRAAGNP